MFHHVKELQFNARVSRPDPRFASLLQEQFGGGNGELKAAMQYFTQAFAARKPYPDKYDLLMDIATEEFGHLEIVGATITMLLDGVNGQLKDSAEKIDLTRLVSSPQSRDEMIQQALMNPEALTNTGGGPAVTNCRGVPWSGAFVNANGDLTVDFRSNIAAEARAKIVYEYLMHFTTDPEVQQTLRFLMTREIAHAQMFQAALSSIEPNFPPGVLQGDPRYSHTYFDLSTNGSVRGPWNQGQGPWGQGESWVYIDDPIGHVIQTQGETRLDIQGTRQTADEARQVEQRLSKSRCQEVNRASTQGATQWCNYPE